MSQWNLEGLSVQCLYMGEFKCTGRVWLSRVKYGGTIAHHVALDKPIKVYGAVRDGVIVDHDEVLRVFSNAEGV
jgi:hypothetical protein